MPSITEINRFVRLAEARFDVRDLALEWPLVHLFGLAPFSTVVVAGAHEGKVMDLLDTAYHGCYIIGYEPIDEYAERAQTRFEHRANLRIVPRALSAGLEHMSLTVDGVHSTAMPPVRAVERTVQVLTIDIADIRYGERIDLMVLNVEGYEGRLLRRLRETGSLVPSRLAALAVQFHEQYDDFADVMLDMVDAGYQKVYDDYPRWVYWKHKDA
jgi:FkbM family methyltransferase